MQTDSTAHSRTPQRVLDGVFAPVDIAFLVYLRIIFGGILLWEVCRFFAYGWISRYYIEPVTHFTYFGFSWVKPWPGFGMFLHFYVLGLCAVCILIGLYYRIAAALFFLGFTYVFLLDQTQYLNHFYLISLFSLLLAFVPAERALSVDARRHPHLRSDTVPAWTLWLMRFQIGLPYFYGGIAKLNPDWLQGEPMRMWLAGRMDFPMIGAFFLEEWMVFFFVIGGLLLDLLIVPLLLWQRTRLWAFIAAVAFHLLNAQLFRIGIFPWFMLAATLVFFPPETPRRWVERLWDKGPGRHRHNRRKPALQRWSAGFSRSENSYAQEVSPALHARLQPGRRMVLGLLGVYVTAQLLVPLRHLAYPGDVNWTEEGHRFSWHMKLRSKRAADARFIVADANSGRSWTVDPGEYLTGRQREKMLTHPDMILQFSHYLANQKQNEGCKSVEVRAQVFASLNGRKPQLLVDPEIDLAKERRSLRPARWIVPLSEPLPNRGSFGSALQPAEEREGQGTGASLETFPPTEIHDRQRMRF